MALPTWVLKSASDGDSTTFMGASSITLSNAIGSPYLQPEPPEPGLVSAAPCFIVCLYWEEPISVIPLTTLQLL